MSNQLPPQIVCFVPVSVPTRYLVAATNKSRALGDDFDVRVTNDLQYNCYFLLEKIKEQVFRIKSLTHPNHYLFCSNDNTRKFKNEFDVRTHAYDEPRNNWIIENAGFSAFTLRSETNPEYYLFIADDFSNQHDGEFDVRTQANENEEKNLWFIINVPNIIHPYPCFTQPQVVQFRPVHLQQHFLSFSDSHPEFQSDYSVKLKNANNMNVNFFLEKVSDNAYIIRSAASPTQVLFTANDKQYNKWNDFDVRFHSYVETRNQWIIESAGNRQWKIRSATNPDQYLFGVQDEGNGQEVPIRTHPHDEDRNKWFIDGFQG